MILTSVLALTLGLVYADDAVKAKSSPKNQPNPKTASGEAVLPLVQPGSELPSRPAKKTTLSKKEQWFEAVRYPASGKRLDKIKEALSKGANIHAKNEQGATALILAAENCDEEVVSFLLDKGASVTVTDKKGHTALWRAEHQEYCNAEKVVALLKKKTAAGAR